MRSGGVDHRPAFGDGQRERLLAVHVLAGPAGVHRRQGVPVVGSRDQNGVDVGPVEQFSIIGADGDTRTGLLGHEGGRVGKNFGIDIAEAGHFGIGASENRLEIARPLVADPDEPDPDPIGGAEGSGGHDAREGEAGGEADAGKPSQELATIGAGSFVVIHLSRLQTERYRLKAGSNSAIGTFKVRQRVRKKGDVSAIG